jgi:hypothetical protein
VESDAVEQGDADAECEAGGTATAMPMGDSPARPTHKATAIPMGKAAWMPTRDAAAVQRPFSLALFMRGLQWDGRLS